MLVVEVVDEFFGAYRIRRWAHALAQHAPHVAVAAGIHVDGEGGHGLLGGAVHRVVVLLGVFFGIGRGLREIGRRRCHCQVGIGDRGCKGHGCRRGGR